ncbi:hypothetical protein [Candidatus Nitrosocosmicus franklandus]|uniref:Uncharacterized protein n=1 Tax=Candidatus Nitrosocosmicus franklandianus TaxID=1798806 RepID=A0A484IAV9_9ARCH|nr:hypothetical protein [Candidatus Nitrosocosmicus franklandus]VFJ13155.1 conserved protein of unknown function [Candidatus Nitrosocosmicus franklandus]
MKTSDLCTLIQKSFQSQKYPLSSDTEKELSSSVRVINKSATDNLKDENTIIETRINEFYVINNYDPTITHLAGMIEMDCLDSFKMLCRRIERKSESNHTAHISIKTSNVKQED